MLCYAFVPIFSKEACWLNICSVNINDGDLGSVGPGTTGGTGTYLGLSQTTMVSATGVVYDQHLSSLFDSFVVFKERFTFTLIFPMMLIQRKLLNRTTKPGTTLNYCGL